MICEICKEPIYNSSCIVIPDTKRCMHVSCFERTIQKAFSGIIGTHDDEIDSLVADACVDALIDHRPVEHYGGLDYV